MSRPDQVKNFVSHKYKFGFAMPEHFVFKSRKGLDEEIVKEISWLKKEPAWMTNFRLKSYQYFKKRSVPTWGGDLSGINFNDIYYYLKPLAQRARRWEDLPREIRITYDRIGIPEAEKKFLAGVGAQYDSEVIYHSIAQTLAKEGVIFLDMDSAVREYPELVKQYFATTIPQNDNKFAALNSAVWSGGSFIYIPKGVEIKLPLQAYFRINAAKMGQFERTLIIAEEGSYVHYVEGCFVAGTKISANPGRKNIEEIRVGDKVLTHRGRYGEVTRIQKRFHSGNLYQVICWGDSNQELQVTEEHPFLVVDRERFNERNKSWTLLWKPVKNIKKGDYLAVPITQEILLDKYVTFNIKKGLGKGKYKLIDKRVRLTPEFARLIGYYLAEGSVNRGFYTSFSFGVKEQEYIRDVQICLRKVFRIRKTYQAFHKTNHGVSLVVSSAEVTRIMEHFGKGAKNKHLPPWALLLPHNLQQFIILAYFRGDGNYYNQRNKHGQKEICRFNTISEELAYQIREILLRLGVVAFINKRERKQEGNRQTIYTVGIGGGYLKRFGQLVGLKLLDRMNNKKRASMFSMNKLFAFLPVKKITHRVVKRLPVFNFSVHNFESYVAQGVAVHNCTAPIYTTDSLHAAVVEIIVKKGARVRYTTIQNWSNNVYNLVTKRMRIEEEGIGEWVDCNLGSKLTMKYPSCYLMGRKARGAILSLAYAGKGQHQDAGGKMVHVAPETSSKINSKSISQAGGRTSYRGLLQVYPGAKGVKAKVVCDALILDEKSRSDTYPNMKIDEQNVQIEHEATVSKIGEEQLFYLMSRGLDQQTAEALIINGFIEPIVKELPLEYAVEMNRLVKLQMEGSVG